MNIPSQPDDELLKALAEEASALPQAAAAHARARRRAQTRVVRVTLPLAVALMAAGIWLSQPGPRNKKEVAHATSGSDVTRILPRQGYVKIYQPGEAAQTDLIPSDASEREKELLTDLPGIPVLIVKNDAGEVARVHIFER